MNQLVLLIAGVFGLIVGSFLGYYARQSIAKRDWKNIEAKLQKKTLKAKEDAESILKDAQEKAKEAYETSKKDDED